MNASTYAHPEALVNTAWIVQHVNDPEVRIIESNEDVSLYDTGHIPGAVHVDWHKDLNDQTIRDYLDPEEFAALASQIGITQETALVFYGDKSNWWACYTLWVFALFGHKDLRILDGGRDKWIAEGRPVTKDKPTYPQTKYPVPAERDDHTIRAFFDDTLAHSKARKPLIDVRSPAEFKGEITYPAEYPQRARFVVGMFRGQRMSCGKWQPTTTAHSNPERNSKRFIRKISAIRRTATQSFTAGSANVRVTPGSY